MTLYSIFAFFVAMLILAITPGPGVIATVSKALSVGLLRTIPLIIGIIVGDLVFLLFSIFGLAFVAESFTMLFLLIKYLGALYLIYLGIKMWNLPPISQNHKRE